MLSFGHIAMYNSVRNAVDEYSWKYVSEVAKPTFNKEFADHYLFRTREYTVDVLGISRAREMRVNLLFRIGEFRRSQEFFLDEGTSLFVLKRVALVVGKAVGQRSYFDLLGRYPFC